MLGKGLALIGTGVLAAAMAFVLNWLALISWRRVKNQHWTERARLYYPVRVAAVSNLSVIPAVLTLAEVLFWQESSPPWALTAIASAIGTVAGTIPMDHEGFPRIGLRDLVRRSAMGCLQRFFIWFVFIGAMVMMPDQFDLSALIIFGTVIVLRELWARGGASWLGLKRRAFAPAPERLQKIVSETAAKMNVSFRDVLLIRISAAQAYAFIGSRRLAFTQRLLDICSDDELAAICAHELGHLTEPKKARFKRAIRALTFMPWLLFNPLAHTYGQPAVAGLLLLTATTPYLSRRIGLKLESRADQIAKSNEIEPGSYARALAKIYEDNLIPAVMAKDRQTHPNLYDRLLAAGVIPDYLRPAPASTMAWHGFLFAAVLGIIFAMFVTQRIPQL